MSVVHLSEVINNPLNQNNCTICLEDYKEEDMVVQGICNHIFHNECLEKWKNSQAGNSNLCSTCRQVWVELDQSHVELYTKIQAAFSKTMGKLETKDTGWLKEFMGGIKDKINTFEHPFEEEEKYLLQVMVREKLAATLAHRKSEGKDINPRVARDALQLVMFNFLHQKQLKQIKDNYPDVYKILEEENADLVKPSTVEELATVSQIAHFRALVINKLLSELKSGKNVDKEFIKSSLEYANTTLQKKFGTMYLRYEISDALKAPENIVKEFDESIAFAKTGNLDEDKLWTVCKELSGKVKEKVAKQKFDEALDEIKVFDYSLNGFSYGGDLAKCFYFFLIPSLCAEKFSIDSMSKLLLGSQLISSTKSFLDKKAVALTDVFMSTVDSSFNRRKYSYGKVLTGALSVAAAFELAGYLSSTSYKQLYNL